MSDTLRKLVEQTITHDLFGPSALTEPTELAVPDKYELLECLGRGGFGVVYKARDRDLGRVVALKFMTDAGRADLERFRREARFTARLNNPAIVRIYELGECDGQPFIALEYIDGGSLADVKLDSDDALRAVRTAAAALAHAHSEGIVHRDVKPANILLDRNGAAYLTDFGIARDVANGPGATLSAGGALLGTPSLMPPEQARGDLHAIDARSDIYALGATLYFLLCDRYPFERPTLVDLLHAVVHDEPPLPRSLNPNVPRAVEAIIVRCMQKERSRRYQTMNDVIADLDAALAGREIAAEGAAWFRKLVGATPPAPGSDPDLYQTVGVEIAREIAAWDANLYRVSRNLPRLFAQLDSIGARLERVIQDYPHFAWARFYRGVAYFRRGRLQDALDEMERSIDRLSSDAAAQFEMGRLYLAIFLRESNKAFKHISRSGTEWQLRDTRSRVEQAVICFREAQRLRKDLLSWQADYADAVAQLADSDYPACVAACDRILALDPDIEDVWRLRGDALRMSGGDPVESYENAVRVRRSDYESYLGLAQAYFERRDYAAARRALGAALEIYPEHEGALALLARACLLAARDASDSARVALLEEGVQHAQLAAQLAPSSYDAAIVRAELLTERGAATRAISDVDAAQAVLAGAKKLDGCQNRVGYLQAQALLAAAQVDGLSPARAAELTERAAWAQRMVAQLPDSEPWRDLLKRIQSKLGANARSR